MGIKNGCNGKFKLLRSHWVEMVEVLSIKTFAADLCVWQSAVICSLAQDTMFGGVISTSLRLSDALLQDCAPGKNAREFNPWDVNGFRIGQENQEYIAYKQESLSKISFFKILLAVKGCFSIYLIIKENSRWSFSLKITNPSISILLHCFWREERERERERASEKHR